MGFVYPIHISMHYMANKDRFTEDGKFQIKPFMKDVGHLYTVNIVPTILFT